MPQTSPFRISWFIVFILTFGLFILSIYFFVVWDIKDSNPPAFYSAVGIGILIPIIIIQMFTKKHRRRRRIMKSKFPDNWRKILEEEVRFYQKLTDSEKRRFEKNVQIFLAEKTITGIKTEVDDQVRVLVAASAIIPIFGFENWDYHNLSEVLIYPGSFTTDFRQTGEGRNVLGMVGEGVMNRIMILSKPALINGFVRSRDGKNTGIHEFVHLLDASDGTYDGIPALLERKFVLPWLGLMYKEIKQIKRRKSELRAYGGTNKQEFFAVASEYFFEKPDKLKQENPGLHEMLSEIFQQEI